MSDDDISDGYHTFSDLYRHRHALFLLALKFNYELGDISLAKRNRPAWWTREHHPDNAPMFLMKGAPGILVGLELLGLGLPEMSIQYHLPATYIPAVDRYAMEIPHAPFYDGSNSPEAVVAYLERYVGLELES